MHTSAYVTHRCQSRLTKKTAYELFTGKKPDLIVLECVSCDQKQDKEDENVENDECDVCEALPEQTESTHARKDTQIVMRRNPPKTRRKLSKN